MSWEEIMEEKWRNAVRAVITEQCGSASLIQRRVRCGYKDAAGMISRMEQLGIIGPFVATKPREVFIKNLEDLPSGVLD